MKRYPRRLRSFYYVGLVILWWGLVACRQADTAVTTTATAVATAIAALPSATPLTVPSPSSTPFTQPDQPPTDTLPAATATFAPSPLPPTSIPTTSPSPSPDVTWILAVAAPFSTIQDEIALSDLQGLWQKGKLLMTVETANLLTAWWGEPDQPSEVVSADELVDVLWQIQPSYDHPVLAIVPFHQLEPRLKVLRVDGAAPIDMNFDPQAYALTLPEELNGLVAAEGSNWDDGRITHIVMTGPAGMRRGVADRMDKYGIQYPGEETGPILQAADIAHMSNENAFATDCPPADPFDSENVCNRDEYFELMTWMGIDVNEMTGNHLNDWGTDALLHTFDLYEENGIQWFGGGRDLEDAAQPLLITHNGNNIAFIGCNPVGPEYDWATADQPGAMPCGDYTAIQGQIRQLADDGYLVFATLQYLEDYQYPVMSAQRQDFQGLAQAGAAAVSGSHGHHPQGFAFVNNGFVHYGLGNLLADQMWSLGSRQTFLDIYTVYDGRIVNVDLWTGLNEDYARIRQMTPEERADFLTAVFEASDFGEQ